MGFDGIVERTAEAEGAGSPPTDTDSTARASADAESDAATADPRKTEREANAARQRRARALKRAAKQEDPAERVASLVAAGVIPAGFVQAPQAAPEQARPASQPAPAPVAAQSPEHTPERAQTIAPAMSEAPAATPGQSTSAGGAAAPSPEAPADLAAAIDAMDMEQFASFVVEAVDGGACKLLGDDMALSKPEAAFITKALGPVLKKHATGEKLTPENVLLLAVGLAYGPRLAPKAIAWFQARRAAQG